ncbi:hypothetical protein RCE85_27580, partial [Klebsiella pneumoniae]|nr:hypothetical protein [Klebsiella pneumoniae]MCE4099277.1 hypothetical protein [Klebsiella pneumoniae]MCE4105012.1 hypothetical protein [Klebsiella pneumoniae]MCE4114965.1 hypothetical protein [Klebsiella pneumoniae]MCF1635576.1 hypothetical protein [Klebsiella pneumoniae]
MPAFEWVHVQLHQQKGMISLSPPTICNSALFLLLENAKSNGIFDFIENDLVFDNDSTNKIKMNHIKTMLCG